MPHSVIQENIRYYDEYITQETAKGDAEEAVIETLGGPKIIARTIVDAAYDTEDRPDGYERIRFRRGEQQKGKRLFWQCIYRRITDREE